MKKLFLTIASVIAIFSLAQGAVARSLESRTVGFAPVEGGRLQYTVSGPRDGEAILFIHGGFATDTFELIAKEPALSQYRLIRYDRRGYGESSDLTERHHPNDEVAEALALLDHLGIAGAHVVAHSNGGSVAFRLAANHPDRVWSLIAIEAAMPPQSGPPLFDPAQLAAEGLELAPPDNSVPRGLVEKGDHDGFSAWFWENLMLGPDWEKMLPEVMPDGAFKQVGEDAADHADMLGRDPALQEELIVPPGFYESIDQPVLALVGTVERSGIRGLPRLLTFILTQAVPQTRLVEMQGLSHGMMLEDPEAVARRIANFVQRDPAG